MMNMAIKTTTKPTSIIVGVTFPIDFRLKNDKPKAIKITKKRLKNLKVLNAKITMIPLEDCLMGFEKSVISIHLSTNKIVNILRFKVRQTFYT